MNSAGSSSRWIFVGVLAVLVGCTPRQQTSDQSAEQAEDAANRSPNATIMPVPLASTTSTTTASEPSAHATVRAGVPADSRGRLLFQDAGLPTPQAMLPGQTLPSDNLTSRDVQGATLSTEWIWTNVAVTPHSAETSAPAIEAARKVTRRLWTIDLTESGRMRIVFDSFAFVLAKFTELRARYDLYGHVLVWPSGEQYRVIPPGSLRAMLDERRIDVTPLMPERARSAPSQGPRFGFPTSRTNLSTATGKLMLDQAHIVNIGTGGALLCRTLVELIATEPSALTCAQNLMPVHAEYTWPDGATLQFEVLSMNMRNEFPPGQLSVPPSNATFTASGLPPNASGVFLTRDQLAAFRTRPLDSTHPRTDREFTGAPADGFFAQNDTDALRFLLVDGVPVAWIPPHEKQYIIGTTHGRYLVQWRSFLGSYLGPATVLEFPALLTLSNAPDAGAPVSPRDQ